MPASYAFHVGTQGQVKETYYPNTRAYGSWLGAGELFFEELTPQAALVVFWEMLHKDDRAVAYVLPEEGPP